MADIADASLVEEEKPAKSSKLPLILGLVGALVLGGAGFYVVWSGLFDPFGSSGEEEKAEEVKETEPAAPIFAFVPMEPIMISLAPGSTAKHLRFIGQLEVDPVTQAEVVTLMPRILDTLNTYLRAVEVKDLEDPAAIQRLRAQMLRRVQVVVGEGRVRDLLITEFILS